MGEAIAAVGAALVVLAVGQLFGLWWAVGLAGVLLVAVGCITHYAGGSK